MGQDCQLAQVARVAADTEAVNAHTRVIGPTPLEGRIVGIGGLLVFVVISTLVSLSDSVTGGAESFLGWGLGLTAWSWVFLQVATSHIAVRSGVILFVDVMIERAVLGSDVARVYGDNGVGVQLLAGGSVESLVYGPSLPQTFRPFRRYEAVANEIGTWLDGAANSPLPQGRRASRIAPWRLRRASLPMLVAVAAGSSIWMLALWAFARPLRILLGIPS